MLPELQELPGFEFSSIQVNKVHFAQQLLKLSFPIEKSV